MPAHIPNASPPTHPFAHPPPAPLPRPARQAKPQVLQTFDLAGVADLIRSGRARRIICMCGAGISVSAGGGRWQGLQRRLRQQQLQLQQRAAAGFGQGSAAHSAGCPTLPHPRTACTALCVPQASQTSAPRAPGCTTGWRSTACPTPTPCLKSTTSGATPAPSSCWQRWDLAGWDGGVGLVSVSTN
jgi:hypothetical protein